MSSHKSPKKNSKPFIYFSIAGILLLLRSKIAMQFGEYYWNAIYHTDMLVIAILMWGMSAANIAKWQKIVIETYVGFIIGDFIDRIFFKNTFVTRWDILALVLAILIPSINYLIENGRKCRNNISKD